MAYINEYPIVEIRYGTQYIGQVYYGQQLIWPFHKDKYCTLTDLANLFPAVYMTPAAWEYFSMFVDSILIDKDIIITNAAENTPSLQMQQEQLECLTALSVFPTTSLQQLSDISLTEITQANKLNTRSYMATVPSCFVQNETLLHALHTKEEIPIPNEIITNNQTSMARVDVKSGFEKNLLTIDNKIPITPMDVEQVTTNSSLMIDNDTYAFPMGVIEENMLNSTEIKNITDTSAMNVLLEQADNDIGTTGFTDASTANVLEPSLMINDIINTEAQAINLNVQRILSRQYQSLASTVSSAIQTIINNSTNSECFTSLTTSITEQPSMVITKTAQALLQHTTQTNMGVMVVSPVFGQVINQIYSHAKATALTEKNSFNNIVLLMTTYAAATALDLQSHCYYQNLSISHEIGSALLVEQENKIYYNLDFDKMQVNLNLITTKQNKINTKLQFNTDLTLHNLSSVNKKAFLSTSEVAKINLNNLFSHDTDFHNSLTMTQKHNLSMLVNNMQNFGLPENLKKHIGLLPNHWGCIFTACLPINVQSGTAIGSKNLIQQILSQPILTTFHISLKSPMTTLSKINQQYQAQFEINCIMLPNKQIISCLPIKLNNSIEITYLSDSIIPHIVGQANLSGHITWSLDQLAIQEFYSANYLCEIISIIQPDILYLKPVTKLLNSQATIIMASPKYQQFSQAEKMSGLCTITLSPVNLIEWIWPIKGQEDNIYNLFFLANTYDLPKKTTTNIHRLRFK